MYRITLAAAMTYLACTALPATGSAQEVGATPPSKRLLVTCMNKEMAARRTLSYNDAIRLCRERVRDQRLTETVAVPANTAARPRS